MQTHLTVGSWFSIRRGCPIACRVMDGRDVEFILGGESNECDFMIEAEALRELLKIGAAALDKMADLHTQEEAENQEPGVEPGERPIVAGAERLA